MKTVVIHKSATGFTKKYAQWIAEELAADIFDISAIRPQQLQDYDCIVFGGRLHAVGIDGVALLTKNLEQLKNKKLIVFTTGASPASESVIEHVRNHNFSAQQQGHIDFFYLRGGFNFAALPLFDKILMSLLKKKIISKQRKGTQLTADESGMLALIDKPADFTQKENISVIIAAARSDVAKGCIER